MLLSPATLAEPRQSAPASGQHIVQFLVAYFQLLTARYEAREQGAGPANVPVECCRLVQMGVDGDALLWMLYQAHVEHFEADLSGGGMVWRPRPTTVVTDHSGFALTALGEAFGELLVCQMLTPAGDREFESARGLLRVGTLTPGYDQPNRLLVWGRHALKQFRQPSANQELILTAAEELEWECWFDDPLPGGRSGNPKERLHDAIKNLNRCQFPPLVRFKGDGTGRRVGWELR
jgi:hypothetical protein